MGVSLPAFVPFASIPRLYREAVITEKIDGTNAVVYVGENDIVVAGSRNRWLTTTDDNLGFARWVVENADELRTLGPGLHHGEWWGAGIQRRYGLGEKRFSLFNTGRWCAHDADPLSFPAANPKAPPRVQARAPSCCHVVPVLYRGPFSDAAVDMAMEKLGLGSVAAGNGFPMPEGIVVWHEASQQMFKVTLGGDGHKGSRRIG